MRLVGPPPCLLRAARDWHGGRTPTTDPRSSLTRTPRRRGGREGRRARGPNRYTSALPWAADEAEEVLRRSAGAQGGVGLLLSEARPEAPPAARLGLRVGAVPCIALDLERFTVARRVAQAAAPTPTLGVARAPQAAPRRHGGQVVVARPAVEVSERRAIRRAPRGGLARRGSHVRASRPSSRRVGGTQSPRTVSRLSTSFEFLGPIDVTSIRPCHLRSGVRPRLLKFIPKEHRAPTSP